MVSVVSVVSGFGSDGKFEAHAEVASETPKPCGDWGGAVAWHAFQAQDLWLEGSGFRVRV